jgi:hypothetical protein
MSHNSRGDYFATASPKEQSFQPCYCSDGARGIQWPNNPTVPQQVTPRQPPPIQGAFRTVANRSGPDTVQWKTPPLRAEDAGE